MSTPSPLLHAVDVSKRYGDVTGLDSLNLSVYARDVYCLLSANGAGTTTTINLFLSFTEPTGGVARIGGIDVTVDPIGTKRRVACIPETVMLYRNLRGLENLEYVATLASGAPLAESTLRSHLLAAGLRNDQCAQRVGAYA